MSEYGKLDFTQPRTVWVTGFQLFYTILAMIPVYFYFREILVISDDARTLLFAMPIGIAILLFLMEQRLNNYFWKSEKTYKNRDIVIVSSKSALTIIFSFYFIFLYFFGFFLSETKVYSGLSYRTVEGRIMTEILISLVAIYFLVIMLQNIQSSRFESNLVRRIQRSRKK